MPISEDEYRVPKFARFSERYPLGEDKKAKFTDTVVNPKVFQGRSNSVDGTGWKQPGYNPNHNSVTVERVNLSSDNQTFKKY